MFAEVYSMSAKRVVAVVVFVGVLAGTLVTSQTSDLEILARVGAKTSATVASALPDAHKVAGPLAAFRAGDALPIEERVRVRIQTDKQMTGADVVVAPTAAAGQVRLRGVVQTAEQRRRAIELAEGTVGVDAVIVELAVPES
jgi:hypothetical protein